MKAHLRTVIAFIAGVLISGKEAWSINDPRGDNYSKFSGRIEENIVKIFDEDRKYSISGSGSNGNYVLYHFGERKFISLNIEKNSFNGLDHGSYTFFNGTVSKSKIRFHDFADNKKYEFIL
jgi:hypothetical protein